MRQTLLRVAEIIANTKMYPALVSIDQSVEFKAAVEAGIVEIVDDQITFTTPELLTDWLARYCALDIASAWCDFTQTAQKLRRVDHLFRILGLPKSATTQLFLSLENDCGKNVLSRLYEAACIKVGAQEPNVVLNAIYFPFCDALPELNYHPTDLADQLGPVLTATESFVPLGKLHGAIEELAKQSQQKAESLLKAFLQRPEQRTGELAANVLKAFWTFNPSMAHQKALQLTKAKIPALQRIGAIAWFSYELPSHEEKLVVTISRLEELCESNDTDILSVVAQALSALFRNLEGENYRRRIREGFLRLSSHEDPSVQYVIARCLVQLADGSADADWFWESLDHLSGVSASHKGIVDNLDLTIYSLVKHHPKRVTRYLQHVVTSRSAEIKGEHSGLLDLYENTVIRLIEKKQSILESTITLWFASKDSRLHQAAADIVARFVQERRHQSGDTIQLDKTELNMLDEEDVHRVMCALAGYLDDFKALAVLLVSVLSREPLNERTHDLIVEALVDVVLYNMPSVGDYLRDLAADAGTLEIVRQVAKESLACSDAYYTPLKNRPRIKEFAPPDIRIHRYNAAQERLLRNLQDKAFNESRFLSMIPVVPTKYGRSSFSAEHGNMTSPIPMRSFNTPIDLPRESIIDPLGWKIKRMQWRHVAMHGLPAKSTMDSVNNNHGSDEEKKSEEV